MRISDWSSGVCSSDLGSTADELASTIAAELTPKYLNDPKVNIQVLGYRPFYIVGEVQKPGSYPYVDGMVVMNAVALAGGFTYRAREDAVYITRSSDPERHKRVADVNAPVQPGDVRSEEHTSELQSLMRI